MTEGRFKIASGVREGRSAGPTAGSQRPFLPPGLYKAVCYRTRTITSYGGRRSLVVYFRIIEGEHSGNEIEMYCTYPKGRITASHKLYDQWAIAIGRKPSKNERFAQQVFRGKMYAVSIRTTNRTFAEGKVMPEYLQYSVVDTIIETITGIPDNDH